MNKTDHQKCTSRNTYNEINEKAFTNVTMRTASPGRIGKKKVRSNTAKKLKGIYTTKYKDNTI